MDWQTPEDAVPSAFVTESNRRALVGTPPASGAWREGDDPGDRRFVPIGDVTVEHGETDPGGARSPTRPGASSTPTRSNAVLVLHALTGDSHLIGPAGAGHPTAGWWTGLVGTGPAPRPGRWFVVAPNMLGGCQGSTGPASLAPDGTRVGLALPVPDDPRPGRRAASRSPTRSASTAGRLVVGGSMGGMQALEWAVGAPDRVERVAVLAAPAALERRPDRAELGAERGDPRSTPRFARRRLLRRRRTATARTAASPSPAGWRC